MFKPVLLCTLFVSCMLYIDNLYLGVQYYITGLPGVKHQFTYLLIIMSNISYIVISIKVIPNFLKQLCGNRTLK